MWKPTTLVPGEMLHQDAKNFAFTFDAENFSASNMWLQRCKANHNIDRKSTLSKSKNIKWEALKKWVTEEEWLHPSKMWAEGHLLQQDQPILAHLTCSDQSHGEKQGKVQITILLAANLDRSKKYDLLW